MALSSTKSLCAHHLQKNERKRLISRSTSFVHRRVARHHTIGAGMVEQLFVHRSLMSRYICSCRGDQCTSPRPNRTVCSFLENSWKLDWKTSPFLDWDIPPLANCLITKDPSMSSWLQQQPDTMGNAAASAGEWNSPTGIAVKRKQDISISSKEKRYLESFVKKNHPIQLAGGWCWFVVREK